jgi:hypothetical protein
VNEHFEIDGVTMAYVARRYPDEGVSGRAMDRLRAQTSTADGVSAMRVTRPSGEYLIVVVCLEDDQLRRLCQRVALGGDAVTLSVEEEQSIGRRVLEVVGGTLADDADQVDTYVNWKGTLGVSPEGSVPTRRPQG